MNSHFIEADDINERKKKKKIYFVTFLLFESFEKRQANSTIGQSIKVLKYIAVKYLQVHYCELN